MYQVEVQVQTLRVPDWISRYCQPERFVPLCSACPQYGKNWACPPVCRRWSGLQELIPLYR